MPIARPAAAVTLEGFELRVLQIPLVSPFTTSFGTDTVREVIIARALTSDGEGWGEIVTGAAPLYSSEYTQSAWDVALRWLVPALLDRHTLAPEDVAVTLKPFVGHRMPKAGLELAVLDAALRAEGRALGEYLGAVHDRVPSGVSVGIQRDPATLVEVVRGYLDEGYVRIKIKIKPGRDVAETAAVRDAFGGIPLQVDANSAYTLADIDTLAELDRFDLLLIEQPLQEDDIVDHATLARHLRTPVCLDESIVSHKAAVDALALGAASVINIKAGRVGGYLEAVAIHDLCRRCRDSGLVRRHARDRDRTRGERRPGGPSGLHAPGRCVGVEPVLSARHRHRARRARGRSCARSDRPRARRRDRPGRARGLHCRARARAAVGRVRAWLRPASGA